MEKLKDKEMQQAINECAKSHIHAIIGLAGSDLSTINTTRSMYSIYSTLLSSPLLSSSVNLRAALLERLDHQPRHSPKKGIRDCAVNRVRKRE
jgi:hypothetical protein